MLVTVITAVMGSWYVLLFAVALVTASLKVRRARAQHVVAHGSTILWGELLFYVVGIGYVYGGIFHAYFQNVAAPAIGWAPSPFEYELGWMEIGLGAVAILSLWRGLEFRLASTIIYAIFSFAAAAQHIEQVLCCANLAPDNAGVILWFGDVTVPLVVLVAAMFSLRDEPRART